MMINCDGDHDDNGISVKLRLTGVSYQLHCITIRKLHFLSKCNPTAFSYRYTLKLIKCSLVLTTISSNICVMDKAEKY